MLESPTLSVDPLMKTVSIDRICSEMDHKVVCEHQNDGLAPNSVGIEGIISALQKANDACDCRYQLIGITIRLQIII
jgi:hypothetical protein